jgi:hypothetical protein
MEAIAHFTPKVFAGHGRFGIFGGWRRIVYPYEVAWRDLPTASAVVWGGKRYCPKVRRKAFILPIAFLGGGAGGDCGGAYGLDSVVGGVRGVTNNVGGCGGVSGCTSGGAGRSSFGVTGGGVGTAMAAARASLSPISPRAQARRASTALRGRSSFGHFSSKYGSTCSVQLVAQSANEAWSRLSSLISLPLSVPATLDEMTAIQLPLDSSSLLRCQHLATGHLIQEPSTTEIRPLGRGA